MSSHADVPVGMTSDNPECRSWTSLQCMPQQLNLLTYPRIFFNINPGRPVIGLSKDMNRFVFLKRRNIAVPVVSLFEVGRLRHDFLHLF